MPCSVVPFQLAAAPPPGENVRHGCLTGGSNIPYYRCICRLVCDCTHNVSVFIIRPLKPTAKKGSQTNGTCEKHTWENYTENYKGCILFLPPFIYKPSGNTAVRGTRALPNLGYLTVAKLDSAYFSAAVTGP